MGRILAAIGARSKSTGRLEALVRATVGIAGTVSGPTMMNGSAATVGTVPVDSRYHSGERLPVEVLVFEVDPEHVEAFLDADHEVWTLGEADVVGIDHIPFLSKEVWLDDAHPGRVILTFVWESIESWRHVGEDHLQRELQARFDERFPHRVTLLRALHEESDFGIHRVSRFERSVTHEHP